MNNISAIFLSIVPELPEPGFRLGLSSRELASVVAAALLVGIAGFIWAVYFRKRPRDGSSHPHSRHHHHHHHQSAQESAPAGNGADAVNGESKRRRRRRRRREHRPRNPTLAETGGLPPIRTEQPPDRLA